MSCFLNGILVEIFYSVYWFEPVYLPSILEADAYISIFISCVSATGSYILYSSLVLLEFAGGFF
jgi:hypothetical protein